MSKIIPMVYAQTFFDNHDLRKFANAYLKALPRDINTLASCGSSGCAIASAMLARCKGRRLYHVYQRKKGERGHRSFRAGSFPDSPVIAIVDDFADTGASVRRLTSWVEDFGYKISYILLEHANVEPRTFGGQGKTIFIRVYE